ncbi:MAG: Ppx/GppA family phosphatase [Deltaproteobacteria bacterium]|nr:Ppx/GppA family phosphatase [Deltaproteobacteria bacterium]
MSRFATLDVGTNTVLLLVAEARAGRFVPVVERMEITRLGRGVDRSGRLAEDAIEETVLAVARFAAEARALGAQDIACVATSAARDAANGSVFLERVRRQAGLTAEIIPGELEARLSFEAATRDLGDSIPRVVLDIGGGSTELVYGERGQVTFKHSFDLGSVRLTERFVRSDPPHREERESMRRELDRAFAQLPPPPAGFTLVGVAGTVTTVCAVARGIDPYDAERVHLARLGAEEVRHEVERYFSLDLAARRALKGMPAKRADVIAAGSLILERVLTRLGAAEVVVSDRGIRWGLLYHRFGHALAP